MLHITYSYTCYRLLQGPLTLAGLGPWRPGILKNSQYKQCLVCINRRGIAHCAMRDGLRGDVQNTVKSDISDPGSFYVGP